MALLEKWPRCAKVGTAARGSPQDSLRAEYSEAVRREYGLIPLSELIGRLANQLKEQGKSEEAEAITRLHTDDRRNA